jgi:hypothetical protein
MLDGTRFIPIALAAITVLFAELKMNAPTQHGHARHFNA